MIRVNEGSRPTATTEFYDVDNVPIVPDTITYKVTRADNSQILVTSTAVTPAQRIEVILPVAATTLTADDEYPVRMAYTVTATFSNGAIATDETFFIVTPIN